jgi:hypothetical protein
VGGCRDKFGLSENNPRAIELGGGCRDDFGVSVDRWIHQIKGGSNIPKVDPPEIHKNEQMKSKALCERG